MPVTDTGQGGHFLVVARGCLQRTPAAAKKLTVRSRHRSFGIKRIHPERTVVSVRGAARNTACRDLQGTAYFDPGSRAGSVACHSHAVPRDPDPGHAQRRPAEASRSCEGVSAGDETV